MSNFLERFIDAITKPSQKKPRRARHEKRKAIEPKEEAEEFYLTPRSERHAGRRRAGSGKTAADAPTAKRAGNSAATRPLNEDDNLGGRSGKPVRLDGGADRKRGGVSAAAERTVRAGPAQAERTIRGDTAVSAAPGAFPWPMKQAAPDIPPAIRLPSKDQEDDIIIRLDQRESFIEITTAGGSHIGTRDYQQDALFVSDPARFRRGERGKAYAVLCDGMGGMADGERASCIAVEDLSRDLDALTNYQDIPGFLESALRKIDRMIYQECGEGSGTTIVTSVILGNQLYWAAAGDSRIYILRDQRMTRVTRDHNYSLLLEKDVEIGKITQEEALTHPQREALISYLGSGDVPLIDANRTPITLEHGDMVLLCSDG
jgi:serine/threonine protein phosphatase PrpC